VTTHAVGDEKKAGGKIPEQRILVVRANAPRMRHAVRDELQADTY
jgi:hypothetical protein